MYMLWYVYHILAESLDQNVFNIYLLIYCLFLSFAKQILIISAKYVMNNHSRWKYRLLYETFSFVNWWWILLSDLAIQLLLFISKLKHLLPLYGSNKSNAESKLVINSSQNVRYLLPSAAIQVPKAYEKPKCMFQVIYKWYRSSHLNLNL